MSKQRIVEIGHRQIIFPSPEVQQLKDNNDIIDNPDALKRQLATNGYLFLRGLHNREEVLAARLAVLAHIKESGQDKLDASQPWQSGVLDSRCGLGCIPWMEGRNSLTHSDAVLRILEGPRPKQFFRNLFGEEPLTFDFKWLRGIHRSGFTGVHVDRVYMGRGTEDLLTMWTPLGDVAIEMGTLVICEGSNSLPSFQSLQDTYGNVDLEERNVSGSGWFTEDPFEILQQFGGQWKTSDFQAGDVLIFPMRTVHMSSSNITNLVRISCDTRWQPSSHPFDPRYVGSKVNADPKYGLHGKEMSKASKEHENSITMEELKRNWGFTK